MLNYDEEEVLKILLKLYKEQNARDISGSFKNFPVKYQIIYKEIITRLESKKFVMNFAEFIAGDFVLTLMPPALSYFSDKQKGGSNLEPVHPDEAGRDEDLPHLEGADAADFMGPNPAEKARQTFVVPRLGINVSLRLKELEKQAEIIGGENKDDLISVIQDIRKIFENLKTNPVIKPNKALIQKITNLSADFPWIYGELVYILGTLMMRILLG